MNHAPTVFIVDDDAAILKALTRLLQSEGFKVKSFHSPELFLEQHDTAEPGCVVLDICMPNLDGLALQQTLHALGCERFIVFMSGYGNIPTSVQAMKAGAVDFLVKPFEDAEFLAAVRAAVEKDLAARKVRENFQSIAQRLATLTRRERQVLDLVIVGRLNKQIAADLGTAEKTIKVHRARVMEKMHAGSLAELVRLTTHIGLGE